MTAHTTGRRIGQKLALSSVLLAGAAGALVATALPASAAADKVTICHATGSATNPYVVISPSAAGVANGHYREHDDLGQGDIIPTFTYNGVTYAAKNGGEAAIKNGCTVPTTYPDYPGYDY
jgi:hypothetical protein